VHANLSGLRDPDTVVENAIRARIEAALPSNGP
jgi:hypothetical protein